MTLCPLCISVYRTEKGVIQRCMYISTTLLWVWYMYYVLYSMCKIGGNSEWRIYQCDTCPLSGDQGSSQHSILKPPAPLRIMSPYGGGMGSFSTGCASCILSFYNVWTCAQHHIYCGKFMLGLFAAIRSPMEVEATAAAVDAICLVLFPPLLLDSRVLDTF